MAARSREERLEALMKRRAEIDARLERLRSQDASVRRKQETRRKIIVGAVLLKEIERNDELRYWFMEQVLPSELKSPRDRAFFGLPPLEPGS